MVIPPVMPALATIAAADVQMTDHPPYVPAGVDAAKKAHLIPAPTTNPMM
jgi:hypothetical protein